VEQLYPSLHQVEVAARDGALVGLVDTLLTRAEDRSDTASGWLARALRVDLATLVLDPALTLHCVWSRGYFVRDPDGGYPLRALLERWRIDNSGRAWARALRPAAHPLWSALEEEYRGDFEGADGLALSDNEVVVLRGGVPRTVLDRTTGVSRVAPMSTGHAPVWELARDLPVEATWGRCRVVDRDSGVVIVDVRVNDDDSYRAVVSTAAGTALFAGGWCGDYDGVVVGVEVATGTLLWRWEEAGASVRNLSCTSDGAKVLVFANGRLIVLDGATGRVLHRGRVDAEHGALDPTGTRLATMSACAVRVWSLDQLSENQVGIRGSDTGFAYAMWSPDGRRLLTGSALCDGVDGRVIRVLRMDTGGYLEGGPPVGARAVGESMVVEFAPLSGLKLWDVRTGAQVDKDPGRRYSIHLDLLWIAPDASSYVHAYRGIGGRDGERASLVRTRAGTTVAHLDDGLVSTVAWSPDSSRFATGHDGGSVRLWDMRGTLEHTLRPAAGSVTGLSFSIDGKVLVAGGEGTTLRLWEVGSGRPLGELPRDSHDLSLGTPSGSNDARTSWRSSPANLERLHGQLGFRARRHPYRARTQDGFVWIEPDERTLPTFRIVADEVLMPNPTGTCWASPTTHIALELDG
jgi:WD40 repeat protein